MNTQMEMGGKTEMCEYDNVLSTGHEGSLDS